jgi:hypothetical protein
MPHSLLLPLLAPSFVFNTYYTAVLFTCACGTTYLLPFDFRCLFRFLFPRSMRSVSDTGGSAGVYLQENRLSQQIICIFQLVLFTPSWLCTPSLPGFILD